MQHKISPPIPFALLSPVLASLPGASISPTPPTALLPLLSPILRQRVQLLSTASRDPWLPLLCYDSSKASKLETLVKNERLEPHPVSGEVEVDWQTEVQQLQYKRLDEETLQALATIQDLGLNFKLVWCVNDEAGGGDGWRIGEVGVLDKEDTNWGSSSIDEAEAAFKNLSSSGRTFPSTNGKLPTPDAEDQSEEDDDDYWAQYDNTPARTPAPNHSPAPNVNTHTPSGLGTNGDGTEEDAYYNQYATVQPAMDNHDPDEAQQNGDIESSLGRDEITQELQSQLSPPDTQTNSFALSHDTSMLPTVETEFIAPRPTSSTGSQGSDTVARLERAAEEENGGRRLSEVGIKQHIGTSVKSLWRLAKVAGIERAEFERIVTTELEVLGMMDEDD